MKDQQADLKYQSHLECSEYNYPASEYHYTGLSHQEGSEYQYPEWSYQEYPEWSYQECRTYQGLSRRDLQGRKTGPTTHSQGFPTKLKR